MQGGAGALPVTLGLAAVIGLGLLAFTEVPPADLLEDF